MAMPIKPTPVLRGREAHRFLKQVEENRNKPLKNTATPCLEAAKKKMREFADVRK